MCRVISLSLLLCVWVASATLAADPWADSVVSYDAGGLTAGDFDDPHSTLGSPSRTTAAWPSGTESVRMTAPPWQTSEVCKIGTDAGGHLIVGFDEPVQNDPLNPFGIDLLVFANAGFLSSDWPDNKTIADPVFAFSGLVGTVAVSQDGVTFYEATGLGPVFPTHAYLGDEADAYASGAAATNYMRPVDPSLALADFAGLTLTQALALYDGGGGGLGIDLSNLLDGGGNPASLDWVRYARIQGETNAIDGFADVAIPEPATLGLVAAGMAAMGIRRQRRGR